MTPHPLPASTDLSAVIGTAANPRPRSWLALAGWLALCYSVAATGYFASMAAVPTWYHALHKPPLTPPDWLFAPVWTVLYAAMGVAIWLGWRTRPSICRIRAIRLFLVQLLLNLTWTWLFFLEQRPRLALIEIALLWAAVALAARTLRTISHPASWLMAAYLVWVTFVAYLNLGVSRLNP